MSAAKQGPTWWFGETLTYFGGGLIPEQAAEPVPGPSIDDYFAELAKEHNLYVVAGV